MLTELRIQNFKSWADTEPTRLAPITGLFGANSSGKTSILQFLLMLKQTVETTDRSRVLNLGDDRSIVDLGTFYDVFHQHDLESQLSFTLEWKLPKDVKLKFRGVDPRQIKLEATFRVTPTAADATSRIFVKRFIYYLENMVFGMERSRPSSDILPYTLIAEGYSLLELDRDWHLPLPLRFYGFPNEVYLYRAGGDSLAGLPLALENLFGRIFYLGPLREYPRRTYIWSGESPQDVGQRGELAIPALMASRPQGVEKHVAHWLKEMGLVSDFSLKRITPYRKEFEVRVKKTVHSPEVLITDVGFGVSQVLPVLTLCYYVPEGSVLILEQPEIHLHPAVQSVLADVLIDAVQTRNIQIILESHSEHLLRRLQRRMAEEKIATDQAALYFCEMVDGASRLTSLELDEYGNIRNWPQDFFGDEMGELTAMTKAAMERQQAV